MTDLQGWASWGDPRKPRDILRPHGVEKAKFCPRCATERIFALTGLKDDVTLTCTRCRYRTGEPLTDQELILVMDRYKLPVPLTESRVAR